MSFLQQFWKVFAESWGGDASRPHEPADNDPLTRFLTRSKWLRADSTIRHRAFLPYRGGVSVFATKDLDSQSVWRIGEQFVAQRAGPTIFGRGDIAAKDVRNRRLGIDVDNNPPRHANLVNWPDDKAKTKAIAQQLAADATAHRKP